MRIAIAYVYMYHSKQSKFFTKNTSVVYYGGCMFNSTDLLTLFSDYVYAMLAPADQSGAILANMVHWTMFV